MKSTPDILVIDDEQLIIDSVKKILSLEDYKVHGTLKATDGLKLLEKEEFDLIISDIMMPDFDGFQLLDEVNKRGFKIPLIITTGYSTVENAVKSLTQGAIDFIPKPFTFEELLTSVKRGLKYKSIKKKGETDNSNELIYVTTPANYYKLGYSSWLRQEVEGSVLIGVTDLFLKCIDNVESFELFDPESEVIQGNTCGYLISSENKHNILSPISGKIIDKNDKLIENPSLIEKDPFFEGWIYRIIPEDLGYEINNITLIVE